MIIINIWPKKFLKKTLTVLKNKTFLCQNVGKFRIISVERKVEKQMKYSYYKI